MNNLKIVAVVIGQIGVNVAYRVVGQEGWLPPAMFVVWLLGVAALLVFSKAQP